MDKDQRIAELEKELEFYKEQNALLNERFEEILNVTISTQKLYNDLLSKDMPDFDWDQIQNMFDSVAQNALNNQEAE